jgi:hypothetical protein
MGGRVHMGRVVEHSSKDELYQWQWQWPRFSKREAERTAARDRTRSALK